MKGSDILRKLAAWLVLAIILPVPLLGQEVLLFEDFDSPWSTIEPPPGWRIVFTGDTSSNDWHRAPEESPPWTDNPTPYALLDSAPNETSIDSLISPPFDCSEHNTITLRCSTFCQAPGGSSYFLELVGSVAGGPFEFPVFNYYGQTIGPELQIFLLPWAANQPEVRLAWAFVGDNNSIDFIALDNITVIGELSGADVGVETVLAPIGITDSGQVVMPEAVVKNYGAEPESFWTHMNIGLGYLDSAFVDNLEPESTRVLGFSDWTAVERGLNQVTCITMLPSDTNPDNDRFDTSVVVRVEDVGLLEIVVPRDTVDSGAVVVPQARVKNFGTDTVAIFFCYFRIGNWLDTAVVDQMAPEEERYVTFGIWTADTSGSVTVACSTFYDSDMNPANDTTSLELYVRPPGFKDVAALEILAPVGTVKENTIVVPKGVVANNGAQAATFRIYFTILIESAPIYQDSLCPTVGPNQIDTFDFIDWQAAPRGDFTTRLRVYLEDDMNPENDITYSAFIVGDIHDVGVEAIITPSGNIQPGPVTPRARIKNYGTAPEQFTVRLGISKDTLLLYTDSLNIAGLQPESTSTVTFRSWFAMPGSYVARCTTELPGDIAPLNNLCESPFTVESVEPEWKEMAPMPEPPSGKAVKRGGGLALMSGAAGFHIYATKGYKTGDFYHYNTGTGQWELRDTVPQGPSEKQVRKGGRLCSDHSRYIYLTKGNNTLEFWRYDIPGDSWHQLTDVPIGPNRKKVKGGTDMAYVVKNDVGYIYLLKGYKTEFYRYNVPADTWDSLPNAPEGAKPKWNKGSWLVYDRENTLYAHKAKYHEFWKFNITSNTWHQETLAGMPFEGLHGGRIREKKSKDGGSADWYQTEIFALKGGNTQQFFKYTPSSNTWTELDTVPTFTETTGKKKRVKHGADIISLGNGTFYALKGNKTREFWRYFYEIRVGIRTEPWPTLLPDVVSGPMIRPNPAHARAYVSLAGTGPALVRAFDPSGKLLRTWPGLLGRTVALNLKDFAPGIYFIRIEQDIGSQTAKLIVE